MKWAVVVFPGSNCDYDVFYAISNILGYDVSFLHYSENNLAILDDIDFIVLPGGFSYGDYLRPGALASFSPVISLIRAFNDRGGIILGICNGFQILIEAGFFDFDDEVFDGALVSNFSSRFISRNVFIKTETNIFDDIDFPMNSLLNMPIAHSEGRFICGDSQFEKLKKNKQILFRYCDEDALCDEESNPNGSLFNIAGITNFRKNVFALMPHPERAMEKIFGSRSGVNFFEAVLSYRKSLDFSSGF